MASILMTSSAAILFGLVYGYLAVAHADLLFSSAFLIAVGSVMLGGYLALGKLYWFRIPFGGIAVSSILYVAAILVSLD
jgi:hypothetical protein